VKVSHEVAGGVSVGPTVGDGLSLASATAKCAKITVTVAKVMDRILKAVELASDGLCNECC
jgi:hypothetical protein